MASLGRVTMGKRVRVDDPEEPSPEAMPPTLPPRLRAADAIVVVRRFAPARRHAGRSVVSPYLTGAVGYPGQESDSDDVSAHSNDEQLEDVDLSPDEGPFLVPGSWAPCQCDRCRGGLPIVDVDVNGVPL